MKTGVQFFFILCVMAVMAVLAFTDFSFFSSSTQKKEEKIGFTEEGQMDWENSSLSILILGDSLTEGYGLSLNQAFPYLAEEELRKKRPDCGVQITNGGISGSTTAGALARLKKHFEKKSYQAVLIALGSNDGLRSLSLDSMKKNLKEAVQFAEEQKTTVILSGFKLPLNYGFKYRREFEQVFKDLAKEHQLDFIPFLLKNVALKPRLNLPDGIHPNAEGHKILVKTVLPFLEKLCKK